MMIYQGRGVEGGKSREDIQIRGLHQKQWRAGCITHSQYMAYLGDCKVFRSRMENLIDAYGAKAAQLIVISDGAPWIKSWIEDAYPRSHIHIELFSCGSAFA